MKIFMITANFLATAAIMGLLHSAMWGGATLRSAPSSLWRKGGLVSHCLLLKCRKKFQGSQEADACMLYQLCLPRPVQVLLWFVDQALAPSVLALCDMMTTIFGYTHWFTSSRPGPMTITFNATFLLFSSVSSQELSWFGPPVHSMAYYLSWWIGPIW